MDQQEVPTFWQIVTVDYVATVAGLSPLVTWMLYFVMSLRERDASFQTFWVLAVVATAVGLPVLALRVLSIRRLFAEGVTVPGKIESVWFRRGRGRVKFHYAYQGEDLQASSTIQRNMHTEGLHAGMDVRVVLDPTSPRRAAVKDLFLGPAKQSS
jgi:hypothetical protein